MGNFQDLNCFREPPKLLEFLGGLYMSGSSSMLHAPEREVDATIVPRQTYTQSQSLALKPLFPNRLFDVSSQKSYIKERNYTDLTLAYTP